MLGESSFFFHDLSFLLCMQVDFINMMDAQFFVIIISIIVIGVNFQSLMLLALVNCHILTLTILCFKALSIRERRT